MQNNDTDTTPPSAGFIEVKDAISNDFVKLRNQVASEDKNNLQHYLRFFDEGKFKLYSKMNDSEIADFSQKAKEKHDINSHNAEILQLISEHEREHAKIIFLEALNANIKIAIEKNGNDKELAKETFEQNQKIITPLINDIRKKLSCIENIKNGRHQQQEHEFNMKEHVDSDCLFACELQAGEYMEAFSGNLSGAPRIESSTAKPNHYQFKDTQMQNAAKRFPSSLKDGSAATSGDIPFLSPSYRPAPGVYKDIQMYPKLVFTLGDDEIELHLHEIVQIAYELLLSDDKAKDKNNNSIDENRPIQDIFTIDYSDTTKVYEDTKKLINNEKFLMSLCIPTYITPGQSPQDWLNTAKYFYKNFKNKSGATLWILVANRLLYIDDKKFKGYIRDCGFICDIIDGIKEIAIGLPWVSYRGYFMEIIKQDIEKSKDDYIKTITDSSSNDLIKFHPDKNESEILQMIECLKEEDHLNIEWKRLQKMHAYLTKLLMKFTELANTDENFKNLVKEEIENSNEDFQAIIKIIVLSKFQLNLNA